MGVSVLGSISIGCHVLVKSCHERTLKIQSFWARERPAISFKLSRSRPYPHPGRLISCKSELVDFDERTSPNEVCSFDDPFVYVHMCLLIFVVKCELDNKRSRLVLFGDFCSILL